MPASNRPGAIDTVSDQLEELKRQRTLVAEHLAWLDRQIAAARPADSVGSPPPASRPSSPIPGAREDAEALFAQFTTDESSALRPPSKAGCWFVFSLLLLGLVAGVSAIIYRAYR